MDVEWEITKYLILLGGLIILSIFFRFAGFLHQPRINPLLMLAIPPIVVFLLPYSLDLSIRTLRSFAPEPVDWQWLASRPQPQLSAALSGCVWQEFGNVLPPRARQLVADELIERDLHGRRTRLPDLRERLHPIVLAHDPLAEDYLHTITDALRSERKRLQLLSCAQTALRKAAEKK